MKREIKETEGTYLQQILYTGHRSSPDQPGDIFFFYEKQADEYGNLKQLMHAVLELDPE